MSQVITLQGSNISALSKLVKKVGDQQKEIILELSEQLGMHNELIEKALEKQDRMELKINRIEQRLMEKEIFNYKKNIEKVEKRRKNEMEKQRLREMKKHEELKEQERKRQQIEGYEEDEDDDQFASCDEDDSKIENFRKSSQGDVTTAVEKTGDPIRDNYAELHTITNKEHKKYIKIGRNTMFEFLKLNNQDNWKFEKNYHGFEVYKKTDGSELPCFKVIATFDFPPQIVFDHVRIPENRIQWDTNYESIKIVKEYPLHTQMIHVKMKSQWPLGNREILLLFQGIVLEPDTFYISGKSVSHKEIPENDKAIRINCIQGSYYFGPANDGKQCVLHYVTEFDFRGSIPKYMVQKTASTQFMDGLIKMKKMMEQSHPDKKYKA